MDKEKFKSWRKEMGFSQAKAAATLHLTTITVENYERGRTGNGKPAAIPHAIALACAAIAAGLKPYGD
ncbi:MAG: XRE family transcriptional regulator [Candidatus Tokpelaia sp.]|uniref:helix-turn-helix domain-containing protein n=1 Tax=Candidatus Tokpelaia sp. TaxID=2233777 RepID=UPI00123C656B|nr:XRE family transcriptional regulator [Candidatus Tokpelaia sp.]KAA6204499.1 MAG: XRE family transcriptional regulator [Candidatus Tokpelaia sp.]KAA6204500.1 MAG: XRE family transcriptional regulator [Candidatus Tokpelaia sp.]KAA6205718.1 MAG: XRE family transcriptional regulator [Candidatus Tokpelaia sp.]KAA6405791.1 XRE family transcriptional regulator [Candidatus Tokpelaia sp.]